MNRTAAPNLAPSEIMNRYATRSVTCCYAGDVALLCEQKKISNESVKLEEGRRMCKEKIAIKEVAQAILSINPGGSRFRPPAGRTHGTCHATHLMEDADYRESKISEKRARPCDNGYFLVKMVPCSLPYLRRLPRNIHRCCQRRNGTELPRIRVAEKHCCPAVQ